MRTRERQAWVFQSLQRHFRALKAVFSGNQQTTEVNMAKFIKGQSGNPAGRPVGITKTTEIRQQLENSAGGVINKLIEMAEGGDIDAIKLVLERICPALKPITQPIILDSEKPFQAILGAVLTGNASVETGMEVMGFVEHCKSKAEAEDYFWTR